MQLVNIEKLTDILLLASFSVKLCYVFVVFDDMLSESLNLFKDDTLLNATKFVQLEIYKVTSVKTCTIL